MFNKKSFAIPTLAGADFDYLSETLHNTILHNFFSFLNILHHLVNLINLISKLIKFNK